MHYIVCEKPGTLKLKEKQFPDRKIDEVLLKVKKVGVCGTDIHAYSGNQPFFSYPRILGHELALEIIEAEGNDFIKKGDKAVVMPYKSCGKCIACRNEKSNCCTNIQVLGVHTDGGMQEIISVPKNLLIPTPNLSYEQMTIVEPLAIGAHAIRRADLKKGETVLVIGCGPIGIGIMKQAQHVGARVIAMDTNEKRLKYVKENLGIEIVLNANDNPLTQLEKITNKDLATVVFDATGHKAALESGLQYMAHGGRYVLVGLSKGDLVFNHPQLHAKETTLLCSRNATMEDFNNVIKFLESGIFPIEKFITHSIPYLELCDRFEELTNPENGVIKATIEF